MKFCHTAGFETDSPASGGMAEFFFKPPTLPAGNSAARDPQYLFRKILTLKSYTNSVEESSSTFKTLYLQSKYPHFNSTY